MVRNIEDVEFSIPLILSRNGTISYPQLSYILLLSSSEQLKLASVLYSEGLVSHDVLLEIYAKYFNIDIINLDINFDITKYYYIEDKNCTSDIHARNGYILCKNPNGESFIVATDVSKIDVIFSYGYPVYLCYRADFYKILESNFNEINSLVAKYFLHYMHPNFSSKGIAYAKYILLIFTMFAFTFVLYPNYFYLCNNIIFLIQNIFKTYLLFYARKNSSSIDTEHLTNSGILPYYTILLPVYQELIQLPNLVQNISNLKYPKSRLDVKLIVEEDDDITLKALSLIDLPDYFHIVKVPYSLPRTKPKAMNYAMQYAIGEYIVIYDAEDKPDKDQLLKALNMFAKLPDEYICLQAKLNYYNKYENLLTRLFSFEYSLWFDFLLEGLSFLNLPITLGGTSNHFKASYLRDIGMWDSHNVTEDAELGIRIYLKHYKTAILNSYTLEEAPISLNNWMHQRSRWIKGYIQTLIVYLHNSIDGFNILDIASFLAVFVFIGFVTYSFVILPWLYISFYLFHFVELEFLLLANLYLVIVYTYMAIYYLHRKEKMTTKDLVTITIWPLYFLLHTIASYKAIYELVFTPFKWNKTTHGVSSLIHHDTK